MFHAKETKTNTLTSNRISIFRIQDIINIVYQSSNLSEILGVFSFPTKINILNENDFFFINSVHFFSDESIFTLNYKNCRYWSDGNPHWMREDMLKILLFSQESMEISNVRPRFSQGNISEKSLWE